MPDQRRVDPIRIVPRAWGCTFNAWAPGSDSPKAAARAVERY
jgi:hypothetical protein